MLKDVEFPIDKHKIVEHIRQQHSDREYKNISDITMAAGLAY
jgi:Protein of unknown function (DUF2795)